MKSVATLNDYPLGIPILADNLLEFHAGRLLLLIHLCGTAKHIDGLTKLAKLDFFVRYPGFFSRVCTFLNKECEIFVDEVDSRMVRYHYGPWDQRYYQVLGFLEARQLIEVQRFADTFRFTLTAHGTHAAKALQQDPAFDETCLHMRQVKRVLGSRSGSALKNLVYQVFDEEVARRQLGQVIEP